MAPTTTSKSSIITSHGYEFGGPLGALATTAGLPILCYLFIFLCNDISGCPVPSLLHPSTLTIDQLKKEAGWPDNGISALCSFKAMGYVLGYYLLSLILYRILPGQEVLGTKLASGGRLKYKLNTFSSSLFTVVLLIAGTIAQGPDFPVWTFIWDNYVQIMTSNLIISYILATYVYIKSFGVKQGNTDNRELAAGGQTGNIIYDWFIGRELNPRVSLPFFGEIDIKLFCELRPGMLGWLILNYAAISHQYKIHGFISDSILLISATQTLYVFDSYFMEPAVLTTMDITTDGFGFMLAFGDLIWVPFTYSLQTRYLAVYPVTLGVSGTIGVLSFVAVGFYIFRAANNEKNRFRTNPNDPRVSHLKFLETKSGSKLLISGWWGTARHINYLGDWIMSWAYTLPTGLAGYIIQHSGREQSPSNTHFVAGRVSGTEVVQGEARGWGMIVTYFYVVYFAVLLVHREMRDEKKCLRKYGEDWRKYQKLVPYRILPGVY